MPAGFSVIAQKRMFRRTVLATVGMTAGTGSGDRSSARRCMYKPAGFLVHSNPIQEEAVSRKDEYVAKMKKQLDDWSTGIDELQVKASLAKAELKVKYEEQIAELRKKRQEGESKLNAIKAAADDSWEHLKGEAERTWGALKAAGNEFKSRMK